MIEDNLLEVGMDVLELLDDAKDAKDIRVIVVIDKRLGSSILLCIFFLFIIVAMLLKV